MGAFGLGWADVLRRDMAWIGLDGWFWQGAFWLG
jgi:hypothetical protein